MKYIESLREGERINEIYLCKVKQSALTKAGKPYDNLILQDKTGTLDAKIWEPGSVGIDEFDSLDYIAVMGDITSFQGNLQLNVKRVRKVQEGEYDPKDYLPVSKKDIDEMYTELLGLIASVKHPYLKKLLESFFVEDKDFEKRFKFHSAAKSVHHGFVGGLLEHTLSVTKNCDYFAETYPILNRDLIVSAAIFHDIGKLEELSTFPENDYTDEGRLLGHIMIGAEMVGERIRTIPGFPKGTTNELKHCILAHHGELEYGSPKKPALAEALALSFADNIDAKMETIREIFASVPENNLEWQGYNRLQFLNRRFQRLHLVDLRKPDIDIEDMRAVFQLIESLLENIVHILFPQSLFKAFLSRGIDAFSNQNGSFAIHHYRPVEGGHRCALNRTNRLRFYFTAQFRHGSDMIRGCPAASADRPCPHYGQLLHRHGKRPRF